MTIAKADTVQINQVLQVLKKTTHVLEVLAKRMDVLAFSQRQIERRLHVLERRAQRSEKARGRDV